MNISTVLPQTEAISLFSEKPNVSDQSASRTQWPVGGCVCNLFGDLSGD